jgi:hypothetical protein
MPDVHKHHMVPRPPEDQVYATLIRMKCDKSGCYEGSSLNVSELVPAGDVSRIFNERTAQKYPDA